MSALSQHQQFVAGTDWQVDYGLDVPDMTGVATEFRLMKNGIQVFSKAGTNAGGTTKEASVRVTPAEQGSSQLIPGVYEYRIRVTRAGVVQDQAGGIFLVRN